MRIFLDEAGFTGEDLFNPDQPVFVLASTILDERECQAIYREVFSGIQARELKHSNLARRQNGQKRIIEFIKILKISPNHSRTFFAHKEFVLLEKLIDLWVEPAMYLDGINLYERGGHQGLSNMCYFCLRSYESPSFLRELLKRFQEMMRNPTQKNYSKFWDSVYLNFERCNSKTKDILTFFLGGEIKLGYPHLLSLPENSLDIALSIAYALIGHWRNQTDKEIEAFHDNSSNMAKEKWMWDAIVSPHNEPRVFKNNDKKINFPLNVSQTIFCDSKDYIQLQFADLLAGSTAAWCRSLINKSSKTEYTEALNDAGISDFALDAIWPIPDVKPTPTNSDGGNSLDQIDFLSEIITRARRTERS